MHYKCKLLKVVFLLIGGIALLANQAFAQGTAWETKAPMFTARYYPGAAVFNGLLYIIGGCTAGECGYIVTNTVEAYDPAADTWTLKASMPTARGWLAAEKINGFIYAVGGTSTHPLNTLEVYDPANDTWTVKAPMSTARAAPAAGVINGELYVVGGWDWVTPSFATLEVYDPVTDTWATKTPMTTARAYPGGGVIDGKLYVVGGLSSSRNTLATLEVYDPTTDTWSAKTPMPTARAAPGVGVMDGKLYVIGGVSESPFTVSNTLEVYDPATDTWTTEIPMPTPRYGPGVGIINNLLYVAGGFNGFNPLDVLEVFTPVKKVIIDIKPGSFPNSINPKNKGNIPVAILSMPDFDASSMLDIASLTFGKTGDEQSLDFCNESSEDVNGDGLLDLVCHFKTQATNFSWGDNEGILKGRTKNGSPIEGRDSVRILK